jgi:hypothetical protein
MTRCKLSTSYVTKEMAARTAVEISGYWADQGEYVMVWVEKSVRDPRNLDWVVRSNLMNGMPVR